MTPARAPFICASCARIVKTHTAAQSIRTLATTAGRRNDALASTSQEEDLPRWRQTPRTMKMPLRVRPRSDQPVWRVNTDPLVVDAAFDSLVGQAGAGQKGSDLLDSETKWVALTHKSFDQGRQGFNDRLAFLGRRIVEWQTSLALLNAPSPSRNPRIGSEFAAALDGIDNITATAKRRMLDKSRLARLAADYKIDKAVRWQPKRTDDLARSGANTVLAHALYSMVGALALRQGGEVAARTVRERILRPLGLR